MNILLIVWTLAVAGISRRIMVGWVEGGGRGEDPGAGPAVEAAGEGGAEAWGGLTGAVELRRKRDGPIPSTSGWYSRFREAMAAARRSSRDRATLLDATDEVIDLTLEKLARTVVGAWDSTGFFVDGDICCLRYLSFARFVLEK